jgi:hypothetical protein
MATMTLDDLVTQLRAAGDAVGASRSSSRWADSVAAVAAAAGAAAASEAAVVVDSADSVAEEGLAVVAAAPAGRHPWQP